jgi:hypothetical protein
MSLPWLTILILVPLFGGIIVACLGAKKWRLARGLALGFGLVGLAGALCLWKHFNAATGDLQFVEKNDWVPSLGIQYFLGVDGLGLLMVMLTAIVVPLSILAAWHIDDRAHIYNALVLWLQAGLFGTFTALNFFHWFLFWELVLIPAFFLIKLWGGPKRGPAATQFFIYTMIGSVTLLLSFLAIRLATGSFDFIALADMAKRGEITAKLGAAIGWKSHIGLLVFFGAFLGFAVKVPVVPFHTWLPAAYTEAPSPVTMLLTGVMSKMGVSDFSRADTVDADAIVVAGGVDHCALGLRGICPVRPQAHTGLFVHQPSRLLPARVVCCDRCGGGREPAGIAKGRGAQRRVAPDVQPRTHGIGAVPICVAHRETQRRFARAGGFRGHPQGGSGVHRPDGHRAVFVPGIAGLERVCR